MSVAAFLRLSLTNASHLLKIEIFFITIFYLFKMVFQIIPSDLKRCLLRDSFFMKAKKNRKGGKGYFSSRKGIRMLYTGVRESFDKNNKRVLKYLWKSIQLLTMARNFDKLEQLANLLIKFFPEHQRLGFALLTEVELLRKLL